ncbi:SGNH/GDSL hydrolase family protein [Vibrio intestinalis]|uniref:SGNH/GDSL hydrolase family protein n=1 Tax=Vibrio intestinalis TaxID=2933291 RepID=UPI0021A5F734|nr:SGNH/GDSL hydrolase family protein [Vibrio intestinalis]
MKSILCFGDSNTWGYVPLSGGRYQTSIRWTSLLAKQLPQGWQVIEEGLPGRTTGFHQSIHNPQSGLGDFLSCLDKYQPNIVIIMLGTNDLQSQLNLTAAEISQGAAQLVKQALHNTKPASPSEHVLLVCPPPIYEVGFAQTGFEGGAEKSQQLDKHYQVRAAELDVRYFNAALAAESSPQEGIHWHAEHHHRFADAIAKPVLDMINKQSKFTL